MRRRRYSTFLLGGIEIQYLVRDGPDPTPVLGFRGDAAVRMDVYRQETFGELLNTFGIAGAIFVPLDEIPPSVTRELTGDRGETLEVGAVGA